MYKGANPEAPTSTPTKPGPTCAKVMQYGKSFLQTYVEISTCIHLVVDEREEVEEKAIKSSRSLNTFWKSLIAAAECRCPVAQKATPKLPLDEVEASY
jgi:hypothetical protein